MKILLNNRTEEIDRDEITLSELIKYKNLCDLMQDIT